MKQNISKYDADMDSPYVVKDTYVHQVNIAVEIAQPTDIELKVSYGVTGCSWKPRYDVRVLASEA